MGESLRKPFIFFVVFTGFFSIVIAQVPSIIRYGGKSYQEISIETEWGALQAWMNITSYDNDTITRPAWPLGDTFLFELDPYDITVAVLWTSLFPNELQFSRRDYYFGPFFHSVQMEPFPLTKSYAESQLDGNVSIFTMRDELRSYYVQIHYDETKYDNLTYAWDDGELRVWVGLGWEQMPTTVNAWNLVGSLLFMQQIVIHPWIDPFIAIGFWGGLAFLVATLISRFIPFIRGG